MLGGPFRYLERLGKAHRKLSKGFWKRYNDDFTSVNKSWTHGTPVRLYVNKSEITLGFWNNHPQNEIRIFGENPIFEVKLFSNASTTFSVDFTNMFNPKCPPNLDLCISKKVVTAWHTDQNICQEKPKSWDFGKMKLKIRLEYSDKTPFFGLKLFFKGR